MRKIVGILALIWVFILPACEVNEMPDDTTEDPVYFTEGTLNGEPFTIEVGPDNVFVESDSEVIEDELPIFSVSINGEECQSCPGSLYFEITGEQNFTEGLEFFDLITQGNYDVISEIDEELLIDLDWEPEGDQGFVTIDSFEFDDPIFLEEGDYLLEAFDQSQFGVSFCEYTSEFVVNEDQEVCFEQTEVEIDDFVLHVDVSEFLEDEVEAIVLIIEEEEIIIEDGIFELFNFQPLIPIIIEIHYFENDCMLYERFVLANFGIEDEWCIPEIELFNVSGFVDDPEPLTVHIVYENEDGNVYTSDSIFDGDWFEIISIEQNMDTDFLVFDIVFSCSVQLVNVENESDIISMELSNAVIPLVFD